MNFRENIQKIRPPNFLKKSKQTKPKTAQPKNKTKNTTRETQKNNNPQSKLRIMNQYTGTHTLVVI